MAQKKNLDQFMKKQYKKRRYYTPNDIGQHNTANDLWVSFFNDVYDLTELIQSNIECIKFIFTDYLKKILN